MGRSGRQQHIIMTSVKLAPREHLSSKTEELTMEK